MLEVNLLGQFEVLRDGLRVTIPTRNAQSLFAYLVLNAGKIHRREKLAGLLWADSSEDNARSNLRHELWRLRKVLDSPAETFFLIDDLTLAFDSHSEYSLDVHKLENLPLHGGTPEDLIGALAVYRGELLPGFYDEWVSVERQRLHGLFETKMTRLLELLQTDGRWVDVVDWGMRWAALGQWPEPAYRALISAYASLGDLPKAAATYERFTQGLQKDLGIRPSEQTQALFKRLKGGWKPDLPTRAPAQTNAPPTPVETTTPVFNLAKMLRTNLPQPLTSFIGRENEIRQVERLVSKSRLVTITGSGGVGKTRLAIQVSRALMPQFKDDVWWIELASLYPSAGAKKAYPPETFFPAAGLEELPGVDLVTQTIAKTLHIPESPEKTPLEAVLEHLYSRQLLLVLDNCEHLIADCAALVERLLENCPEITILATSREALSVPGEKAWHLPSLSVPEQGRQTQIPKILESEAVNLFIERTVDVLPEYCPDDLEIASIAQICQQLDGIPLAIELAAARMSLLSTQEIAARLNQNFNLLTGGNRTALPRQQTLRATIEWSFDLLSPPERTLFRRLSIFASSFTLEAAEAICTDQEIPASEVLTLLGRLVDKSLLNVEPAARDTQQSTRYRFLVTICNFGREKLDESGETRWMHDRHADYYVRLVEAAEPELLFQNHVRWRNLLVKENDNLRAVVEWSTESDQAESALRLAGALLWHWFATGSNREGRELALQALASPSAVKYKRVRARALNTAGFFLCLLGNTNYARKLIEEALAILRTIGDEADLAWSLQFLGLALTYDNQYDQADAAFKEGLALNRKQMAEHANSFVFFLGDIDLLRGDAARAEKTYAESAELFRSIDNKSFLAYPLRRLGYLALDQDEIQTARKFFLESLILNHEVGDIPGVTASLNSMAALALHLANPELAACLCGVVESQLETLSMNLLNLDQVEINRVKSQLLSGSDKAVISKAFTSGWEMSLEQAFEMVKEVL